MKQSGQIVLTTFPHTDLTDAKLRPVLMLRQTSERFDDWLVCMVSSQIHQAEPSLDELIVPTDVDFADSGLKAPSVFRLSWLAVLNGDFLTGAIGAISDIRLKRMHQNLADWIVA